MLFSRRVAQPSSSAVSAPSCCYCHPPPSTTPSLPPPSSSLAQKRLIHGKSLEILKSIPEFEAGLKQQSLTEWRKSLHNFHRVREIIVNSMGSKSDLVAATDLKFDTSLRVVAS
jgi:hypothetical protein